MTSRLGPLLPSARGTLATAWSRHALAALAIVMLADATTSPKPSRPPTNPTSPSAQPPLQALTYDDGSASLDDAQPRTLEVGGDAVALTEMGPIVINADGSLARISNWAEMSEHEREVTKRRITKRNAERLALLRSEQPPPDGGENGDSSGKERNALPPASSD